MFALIVARPPAITRLQRDDGKIGFKIGKRRMLHLLSAQNARYESLCGTTWSNALRVQKFKKQYANFRYRQPSSWTAKARSASWLERLFRRWLWLGRFVER